MRHCAVINDERVIVSALVMCEESEGNRVRGPMNAEKVQRIVMKGKKMDSSSLALCNEQES